MNTSRRTPRAFTLIELLIIVAIIGILAALALPHLDAERAKVRKSNLQGYLLGQAVSLSTNAPARTDRPLLLKDGVCLFEGGGVSGLKSICSFYETSTNGVRVIGILSVSDATDAEIDMFSGLEAAPVLRQMHLTNAYLVRFAPTAIAEAAHR